MVITKFQVQVSYNGVPRELQVHTDERVQVLLKAAIAAFCITQNPHLLSLFKKDGTELQDQGLIEDSKIEPCEHLVLRPSVVKAG